MLADRKERKPLLLLTAILTPLFLAMCALIASAPLSLATSLTQGFVSTAYWVTILPLLVKSTTKKQRIGVLPMNSFLLLGIGALGNLLGGAIPELMAGILHVSAAATQEALAPALFTFVYRALCLLLSFFGRQLVRPREVES